MLYEPASKYFDSFDRSSEHSHVTFHANWSSLPSSRTSTTATQYSSYCCSVKFLDCRLLLTLLQDSSVASGNTTTSRQFYATCFLSSELINESSSSSVSSFSNAFTILHPSIYGNTSTSLPVTPVGNDSDPPRLLICQFHARVPVLATAFSESLVPQPGTLFLCS
jgi:hypothetical protein